MRVLRIIARLLHEFESHIYFTSKLLIVWKLSIEGGNYLKVAIIWRWKLFEGGNYSRMATIPGWQLFKGSNYSRAVTIRGWPATIQGGNYSRMATIWWRQLFEGGNYSRAVSIQIQYSGLFMCVSIVTKSISLHEAISNIHKHPRTYQTIVVSDYRSSNL